MKSRRKTSTKGKKRHRRKHREDKTSLDQKWKFRVVLFLLVLVVLYQTKRFLKQRPSVITSDSDIPPMIIPEKKNTKKKTSTTFDPENPSWSEFQAPLVQKLPARECKISKIAPQVIEPLIYLNRNKGSGSIWRRRAVTCIDICPKTLLAEFESRRFKNVAKPKENHGLKVWDSTFVFLSVSKLQDMYLQSKLSFNELYFNREGVTYLNNIMPSKLLTKGKSNALSHMLARNHRITYTEEFGCSYLSMNIENTGKEKYFIMRKKTPVIKVHVLIASSMPYFVFTMLSHVTLGDKSLSLGSFQNELAVEKKAGSHYVDTLLYSNIKKSCLFIFQSIRKDFLRRRGSFLFLTVSFKLSESFHVYMDNIEVNSDMQPKMLKQNDFKEALDLIQELHELPVAFNSMVKGDKYGRWELIFSEKQETCDGVLYNPCILDKINERNLRKPNLKVAKVHNAANRIRHEEARIKKKMEEQKKEMCKRERLSYPGSRCDKRQKQLDSEKFSRLFQEHEKSYNPYQFRMAEPGEVFSWETV